MLSWPPSSRRVPPRAEAGKTVFSHDGIKEETLLLTDGLKGPCFWMRSGCHRMIRHKNLAMATACAHNWRKPPRFQVQVQVQGRKGRSANAGTASPSGWRVLARPHSRFSMPSGAAGGSTPPRFRLYLDPREQVPVGLAGAGTVKYSVHAVCSDDLHHAFSQCKHFFESHSRLSQRFS